MDNVGMVLFDVVIVCAVLLFVVLEETALRQFNI